MPRILVASFFPDTVWSLANSRWRQTKCTEYQFQSGLLGCSAVWSMMSSHVHCCSIIRVKPCPHWRL